MDKVTLVPGRALPCWSCLMQRFQQRWDVFTHVDVPQSDRVVYDPACTSKSDTNTGEKLPASAFSPPTAAAGATGPLVVDAEQKDVWKGGSASYDDTESEGEMAWPLDWSEVRGVPGGLGTATGAPIALIQ